MNFPTILLLVFGVGIFIFSFWRLIKRIKYNNLLHEAIRLKDAKKILQYCPDDKFAEVTILLNSNEFPFDKMMKLSEMLVEP